VCYFCVLEQTIQLCLMSNTKKILLVDDEPDILDFLSYNLKKEGYEVFTAENGAMALPIVAQIRPDAIVLDVMMPLMDGIETCKQIRKNPDYQNIMILFLTAREEDYTQIAALEVGGDDYITKPARPSVLVSRIKALLRRVDKGENVTIPTKDDNFVKYGDLLIDKERVTVNTGDKNIDLTKKEFELLLLLLQRPGKVYTREEIFFKIWGNDVIVGDRTIDVHIRKLREKIGENYIGTVKGIGYRISN
jgi:two-component system, OmpR family, alkaline phosphatase synthesis response regulator PhoP